MPRSVSAGEPCPGRIVVDAGTGFALGALGGSVFHFIKGLRSSPNGARIVGGMQAVRMNAPRMGGSFAAWGALFSTFNCATVYLRQREDPWNSIVAGAATGGLLSARRGLAAAARSAAMAGAFFALFEGRGVQLLANRTQDEQAHQNPPSVHDPNWTAIADRIQAAQQNLPHVEETKKPNDNGGEI